MHSTTCRHRQRHAVAISANCYLLARDEMHGRTHRVVRPSTAPARRMAESLRATTQEQHEMPRAEKAWHASGVTGVMHVKREPGGPRGHTTGRSTKPPAATSHGACGSGRPPTDGSRRVCAPRPRTHGRDVMRPQAVSVQGAGRTWHRRGSAL